MILRIDLRNYLAHGLAARGIFMSKQSKRRADEQSDNGNNRNNDNGYPSSRDYRCYELLYRFGGSLSRFRNKLGKGFCGLDGGLCSNLCRLSRLFSSDFRCLSGLLCDLCGLLRGLRRRLRRYLCRLFDCFYRLRTAFDRLGRSLFNGSSGILRRELGRSRGMTGLDLRLCFGVRGL